MRTLFALVTTLTVAVVLEVGFGYELGLERALERQATTFRINLPVLGGDVSFLD